VILLFFFYKENRGTVMNPGMDGNEDLLLFLTLEISKMRSNLFGQESILYIVTISILGIRILGTLFECHKSSK
jgi:hypothetical protein